MINFDLRPTQFIDKNITHFMNELSGVEVNLTVSAIVLYRAIAQTATG